MKGRILWTGRKWGTRIVIREIQGQNFLIVFCSACKTAKRIVKGKEAGCQCQVVKRSFQEDPRRAEVRRMQREDDRTLPAKGLRGHKLEKIQSLPRSADGLIDSWKITDQNS